MPKDLEKTKPTIPKNSGETSATGGFKNRGTGLTTRSAGFSGASEGMFTKAARARPGGRRPSDNPPQNPSIERAFS